MAARDQQRGATRGVATIILGLELLLAHLEHHSPRCERFTAPVPALPLPSALPDHYENLYAVLTGTKVFTLLPPSDIWRMHLRPYPAGRWVRHPPAAAAEAGQGSETSQQQQHQEEPLGDTPVAEAPHSGADKAPRACLASGSSSDAGLATAEGTDAEATSAVAASCSAYENSAPSTTSASSSTNIASDNGTGVPMVPVLKQPAEQVVWCAINPRPGEISSDQKAAAFPT